MTPRHSLGSRWRAVGPLCASPTISTAALPKPLCNPSSDLRLFGSLEFGLSTEAAPGVAYGWPSGLLGGPRSCFFSLLRCFYFSSWPSLRSRKHDVCSYLTTWATFRRQVSQKLIKQSSLVYKNRDSRSSCTMRVWKSLCFQTNLTNAGFTRSLFGNTQTADQP